MDIRGKSVVVSGGASGLGAAAVNHFINLGANVASLDLSYQDENFVDEYGVLCLRADVTSEESISNVLKKVQEKNMGVDILINAAGVAAPFSRTYGSSGPYSLDLFRRVLEVNLVGSFNCARLVAGIMNRNTPNDRGEKGVIVHVSSINAMDGPIGTIAYTAAKAGVQGMTLTMARDLARYGIRVCTIAPGSFMTPMLEEAMGDEIDALLKTVPFPNDALGDPKDFAYLAESICRNSMMNGETVRLDGAARLSHC